MNVLCGSVIAASEPGIVEIALGGLLIFVLRVTDVSVDTLRILSMVKGHKWRAAALGALEAGVFICAISHVLRPPVHWIQMTGYALGFGVGTLVGITIAQRISSTFVLLRVLSRSKSPEIRQRLLDDGFRVICVRGEGKLGPVDILFGVMNRRMVMHAMELVSQIDPEAFVVVEQVEHAMGGNVPSLSTWRPSVRH